MFLDNYHVHSLLNIFNLATPNKIYPSLNSIQTNDKYINSFINCYNNIRPPTIPHTSEDELIIDKIIPNDNYNPPKYPIVLCHGLSGFDQLILIPSLRNLIKLFIQHVNTNNTEHFLMDAADTPERDVVAIDYWIGVKEILEAKGCSVITARVPSFGSIEERALALHELLEANISKRQKKTTGERVKLNLIAHSMGGLDSRYLISRIPNKKNYQIMSLTTIATPHRGSEMADFVIEQFETLKKLIDTPRTNSKILPICFYQLGTKYMNDYFNLIVPNDPNVHYFSYGSKFVPKWFNVFGMSWQIIYDRSNGLDNDGMVTVKSAKWGEYKGTLNNIDHLDVINWQNRLQKDIDKLFIRKTVARDNSVIPKADLSAPIQMPPEDFDILQFYLEITDNLAKHGC